MKSYFICDNENFKICYNENQYGKNNSITEQNNIVDGSIYLYNDDVANSEIVSENINKSKLDINVKDNVENIKNYDNIEKTENEYENHYEEYIKK